METSQLSNANTKLQVKTEQPDELATAASPPAERMASFDHRSVKFTVEMPELFERILHCRRDHAFDGLYQCTNEDNPHLLCRHCLEHKQKNQIEQPANATRDKCEGRCPEDGATIRPDMRATREIKSQLLFKCPSNITYKNSNCQWDGHYEDIARHLDGCTNVPLADRATILQHARKEDGKTISELSKRIGRLESQACEKPGALVERQVESLSHQLQGLARQFNLYSHALSSSYSVANDFNRRINTLEDGQIEFRNAISEADRRLGIAFGSLSQIANASAGDCAGAGAGATASSATAGVNQTDPIPINGTKVWVIDEFANILRLAKLAKTGDKDSCITSPPFYTAQYGYKLCIKIYPNGNGEGRGSHISLFLAVMKGKYDAVRSWPFSHPFTLSIIDQNGICNHSLTVNEPSGPCFQRPTGYANPAFGFDRFLEHSELEKEAPADVDKEAPAYIKDGTIFIKASVHTDKNNPSTNT